MTGLAPSSRRFTDDQLRAARAVELASIGGMPTLLPKGKLKVGVCPFHVEKSGSFTVFPDNHFHCYGCGAHGDPIAFVMKATGKNFPEAIAELLGDRRVDPAEIRRLDAAAKRRDADHREERDRFLRAAWRLWEAARTIVPGDPVWRYLAARTCRPEIIPRVLRYHPALSHQLYLEPETRKPLRTWHGMVARVDNRAGAFVGVHRTYFAGADVERVVQDPELKERGVAKITLGDVNGGAVRLFDEALEIGVAEGVEDALSAHLLSGLPVWSCLDHGKLGNVELPLSVGHVTIFADRDKPQTGKGRVWAPEGVGMRSARKLAKRLRGEQRGVRILLPREGRHDFNDERLARLEDAGRLRAGSVEAVVAP